MGRGEAILIQKYYAIEYGILEQTCATTAINVFTCSTFITCDANEHWLLWQVHNIHNI